jgi:hypothetical protein
MWLEAQLNDYRIVMAVDVCVYTVQALEQLAEERREGLGEWDT